jgi:hypothetical protein
MWTFCSAPAMAPLPDFQRCSSACRLFEMRFNSSETFASSWRSEISFISRIARARATWPPTLPLSTTFQVKARPALTSEERMLSELRADPLFVVRTVVGMPVPEIVASRAG